MDESKGANAAAEPHENIPVRDIFPPPEVMIETFSKRLRYSNSSSDIDCVRRVPPATL